MILNGEGHAGMREIPIMSNGDGDAESSKQGDESKDGTKTVDQGGKQGGKTGGQTGPGEGGAGDERQKGTTGTTG